jgi:hypothetical protein
VTGEAFVLNLCGGAWTPLAAAAAGGGGAVCEDYLARAHHCLAAAPNGAQGLFIIGGWTP